MIWPLAIPACIIAFAFICRWLLDNPREDVAGGLVWHTCRFYARVIQRARYSGLEHVPTSRPPGPLIIVSNHPSGVDPLLIIAACRFDARYIMARDMRIPVAEAFWKFANIIMVDRNTRDASGTREAIRHITGGGAVAIFPEGGIERPARTLRNFQAGVGLLIRKTEAPVLPVVIRGAPTTTSAWAALWTRGRAVVEFKPQIRFAPHMSAQEIAATLELRYQQWTGWPLRDSARNSA